MRAPGLMTKCKSDRGAFLLQCSASGQVAAGTKQHRGPSCLIGLLCSAPGEIGVFLNEG